MRTLIRFVKLCVIARFMLIGLLPSQAEATQQINWILEAGDYEISVEDGYHRIDMDGFQHLMSPGKPLLPFKNFLIALPPGALFERITVTDLVCKPVPGTYTIIPAPPIISLKNFSKHSDEYERMFTEWKLNTKEIYSSDTVYPEKIAWVTASGGLRKYRYISVGFCPFEYYPESRRLFLHDKIQVSVTYCLPDPGSHLYIQTEAMKRDIAGDTRAKRLFINFSDIRHLYLPPEPASCTINPRYDYVVITTPDLLETLQSSLFIPWKESLGYNTKIVLTTDKEISEQTGRDLAEKIRNFLMTYYIPWGIEYVLLVGDYETVPMRYCYPDDWNHTKTPDNPSNPGGAVPTDYYYADLSDAEDVSWDADGDGFPGEYEQDNPDFLAEVYVGRIPVKGIMRINYTLNKLVSFEQDLGSWKSSALHAGAIMFFANQDHNPWPCDEDGATLMYQLETSFMNNWTISHYSERDGISPSVFDWPRLTEQAFYSDWKSGKYSIVNWAGHGWPACASRTIWASDDGDDIPESHDPDEFEAYRFIGLGTSQFDDDYPSVVFAVSCNVGYPEPNYAGNLGIDLLSTSYIGSSIGVLSATRGACIVGEWPDNPGGAESMCYEFNRYLIAGPNGPERMGDALYNSKFYVNHNFPLQHKYEYQNMYVYNLYGDPSLRREGSCPKPTPTPTPAPTATPECPDLGVELWIPSNMYCPGDPFECRVYICNPGSESLQNVLLFVILDVYGELFFAPSFSEFDYYPINVIPGRFQFQAVSEFDWPDNCGSADGIIWYAGMTDADMTALLGVFDQKEFGWHSQH